MKVVENTLEHTTDHSLRRVKDMFFVSRLFDFSYTWVSLIFVQSSRMLINCYKGGFQHFIFGIFWYCWLIIWKKRSWIVITILQFDNNLLMTGLCFNNHWIHDQLNIHISSLDDIWTADHRHVFNRMVVIVSNSDMSFELSRQSIVSYRVSMQRFVTWVQRHNTPLWHANSADVV